MKPSASALDPREVRQKPELAEANIRASRQATATAKNTEMFAQTYHVRPAKSSRVCTGNVTGNSATALGCVRGSAGGAAGVFGGYPITPASDILHELSNFLNYGVTTFQAEDEIAGVGSTIGAAYAGSLRVTATSGPGVSPARSDRPGGDARGCRW